MVSYPHKHPCSTVMYIKIVVVVGNVDMWISRYKIDGIHEASKNFIFYFYVYKYVDSLWITL